MSYMHDTEYTFGTLVWHTVSKMAGIVISIQLAPRGVMYCVRWKDMSEKWHYPIELTMEDISVL
jgi:hypothetical protein